MAVDKLVDSAQLDSDLEDIADAIRAKSGGSGQLAFPAGFISEIGNIPSGGGNPTNGVVFTALNTAKEPTECVFYGEYLPVGFFGRQADNTNVFPFRSMNKVTLMCTSSGDNCFRFSNVTDVIADELLIVKSQMMAYAQATVSFSAKKATKCENNSFANCTALQNVQIGSVGYAVTSTSTSNFANVTQTGLTITIYTTGSYADTLVADIRNGATNATIIIKASENTTYGGNSYAAGATILTSTP